ncbi:MAG TPA: hypothetical protein VGK50_04380 [Coriobacteriia bacterium]
MAAVPHTLDYVTWSAVVLLLALLPALPIALGLGRRAGWDLPSVLTAAFALQVAVVGVVSLAAHYLALSLAFVGWASAALLLALGVAASWPPGAPRFPRPRLPALALGIGCLGLGVFERTWFYQSADAFYHLAAVRSLLATGRPMVTDPLYGTSLTALDPTSGVWHTVLAVWSRFTGADVIRLWAGAPAVGGAITVMAFWVLARRVSRSDAAATLAAAGWLGISLAADLRWFAYPNRLSLSLGFVTLAALVALVSERRLPDAALASAAGFATASMHLAAAEVVGAAGALLLGVLALAALARRAREGACDWRPVLAVTGVGCAIALLSAPLLLPRAAIVGASRWMDYGNEYLSRSVVRLPGGMLADQPGALMQIGVVTFLAAAALALGMAAFAIRTGDPVTSAAAALTGLPLVLLANPPLTTALLRQSVYLTSRVALLLPFTAFVGAAWALAAPVRGMRMRVTTAGLAAVLVAAALASSTHAMKEVWAPGARLSVFKTRKTDIRQTWGEAAVARMSAEVGTGYPMVAGDPDTTYYLAGVLPVAAVAVPVRHSPFAVEAVDGEARRVDMLAMTRSASETERRRILERWHASYVVVTKSATAASVLTELRSQRTLLRAVVEGPGVVLFEVRR